MRKTPWTASILTLFPEAFPGLLGISLPGSALKDAKWSLEAIDIRDFSANKHRSVDTAPIGGGAGMVLRPDISAAAIDAARQNDLSDYGEQRPLIYLTPRGAPLTQKRVKQLASGPGLIVFCGRFEGLDERVIKAREMEEISLGDFVLAGGEAAAQVLIEACVRLLPGVLGAAGSVEEESFEGGLLEYPLYARPRNWEGRDVPQVLLSGNHAKIEEWRQRQRQDDTRARRPDLWLAYQRALQEQDHECD